MRCSIAARRKGLYRRAFAALCQGVMMALGPALAYASVVPVRLIAMCRRVFYVSLVAQHGSDRSRRRRHHDVLFCCGAGSIAEKLDCSRIGAAKLRDGNRRCFQLSRTNEHRGFVKTGCASWWLWNGYANDRLGKLPVSTCSLSCLRTLGERVKVRRLRSTI